MACDDASHAMISIALIFRHVKRRPKSAGYGAWSVFICVLMGCNFVCVAQCCSQCAGCLMEREKTDISGVRGLKCFH